MENIKEAKNNSSSKLREGNISLILDSYDALFSDFDPRPDSERGLSDDFLVECKRAIREKEGITELRLLMPAHMRKANEEHIIKKRLKEYFRKHLHEEKRKIRKIRTSGIIWFFIGSIILTASTFLFEYKASLYKYGKFLIDFLVIISQPFGWFTIWEGLENIFVVPREKNTEYKFFKKMSSANIYFLNY